MAQETPLAERRGGRQSSIESAATEAAVRRTGLVELYPDAARASRAAENRRLGIDEVLSTDAATTTGGSSKLGKPRSARQLSNLRVICGRREPSVDRFVLSPRQRNVHLTALPASFRFVIRLSLAWPVWNRKTLPWPT